MRAPIWLKRHERLGTVYPPALPPQPSETLLRRCRLVLTPAAPPEGNHYQQHENHEDRVEALHVFLQPLPVPPEQISRSGNHGYPKPRSEKVEDQESPPRHE